ncbi:MAG: hypothetical protein C4321_08935, partial [Chloroflexota bacterium]
MRLVRQGVKALGQERLDPKAHADFTDLKVTLDPGDTEAGIGEPHHLPPVARPLLEFKALFLRQS